MRKAVAIAAGVALLLALTPARAFAGPPAPTPSSSGASTPAPDVMTVAKAEQGVRKVLPIPAGYQLIRNRYTETQEPAPRVTWSLTFALSERPTQPGREYNVDLDARTGQVYSFSFYQRGQPAGEGQTQPPLRYTFEEGAALAEAAVAKLAPDQAGAMRRAAALPLQYGAGPVYSYEWQRVEKSIPVVSESQADGATVTIDGATGELTHYEFRWTDGIQFPDAMPHVSAAAATTAWLAAPSLELRYNLRFPAGLPDKPEVVLRYAGAGRYMGLYVDAQSGQLVAAAGKPLRLEAWRERPTVPTAVVPARSAPLTKDEAIAWAKRYLTIPTQATLTTADRGQGVTGGQEWTLVWSDGKQGDPAATQVQVRVEAATGIILSYYSWGPGGGEAPKTSLTRAQAQEKMMAFLRSLPPMPWGLRLVPTGSELGSAEETSPPSLIFELEPLIHGIPFDGFTCMVTLSPAGEVTSFGVGGLRPGQTFPATGGVLTQEQMQAAFRTGGDLELVYMVQSRQHTATLLYRTPSTAGASFDPFTGHPLDYEGHDLSDLLKPVTDIQGHWAEREIRLAMARGLLLPTNGSFHPNQALTRLETVKLMLTQMGRGPLGRDLMASRPATFRDVPPANPDFGYVEAAVDAGLLDKELDQLRPDAPVTREEFAVMALRATGLGRVAAMKPHVELLFADSSAVTPRWQNYVGLAAGLEIMRGYGDGRWHPADPVTRAMAAVVLQQMAQFARW